MTCCCWTRPARRWASWRLDAPYLFVLLRQAPGDKPHFDRRTHFHYWNAARLAFQAQLEPGHWLRERVELAGAKGVNGTLKFQLSRATPSPRSCWRPRGCRASRWRCSSGTPWTRWRRPTATRAPRPPRDTSLRARAAQRDGRLADLDAARARRAAN